MEWYYILAIVVGVQSPIWLFLITVWKMLTLHLTEYAQFYGKMNATIEFFRQHFKELDEALNGVGKKTN